MKKYSCIICVLVLFLSSCSYYDRDEQADYFYKINQIVKDIDFYTAKVGDFQIVLSDKNDNIIEEIEFPEYDSKIQLIYVRKEKAKIYFVTGGTIDDETGIVFVNDGSDDIMDGLWALERVGGGAYKYRTYP